MPPFYGIVCGKLGDDPVFVTVHFIAMIFKRRNIAENRLALFRLWFIGYTLTLVGNIDTAQCRKHFSDFLKCPLAVFLIQERQALQCRVYKTGYVMQRCYVKLCPQTLRKCFFELFYNCRILCGRLRDFL